MSYVGTIYENPQAGCSKYIDNQETEPVNDEVHNIANLIPARVFEDYPFLLDLPLSGVENNTVDPADMSLSGNKFLKVFFFFFFFF